jgi:hypothetical protein
MAGRDIALAALLMSFAAAPLAAACVSEGAMEVPGLRSDGPLGLAGQDGRRFRLVALQGDATPQPVAGLKLAALGPPNRHGRIPAQGFVGEEPYEMSLLAEGLARLTPTKQLPRECWRRLEGAENAAVASRLGLWARPDAIIAANDATTLRGAEGRFSILQGRVLSVRSQGRITYVNFGPPNSGALTVTILERDMAAFRESGLEPAAIRGQILRVRGVVTIRRGPTVAAAIPEALTIAETPARGAR